MTTSKGLFSAVAFCKFITLLCTSALAIAAESKPLPAQPTPPKSLVDRVAAASRSVPGWTKGLRPRGDGALDEPEVKEIEGLYRTAQAAYGVLSDTPEDGAKRRAVHLELMRTLENHIGEHPNSSWVPDMQLRVAQAGHLRGNYSKAIQFYGAAWLATKDSEENPAREIALEAVGPLVRLLALTGRNAEYVEVVKEAQAKGKIPPNSDWRWASMFSAWSIKHPTEGYKCGLYSLDQLGRLAHGGQFNSPDILELESSPQGFSAAELVAIGQKVGLPVTAVGLENMAEFPVPCVVHLNSEHFVVVRERRGEFYQVLDTVAGGPRWLTAADIADDASGCLLVSSLSVASPGVRQQMKPLGTAQAGAFRGRCHPLIPYFYGDPGSCPPPGSEDCEDCPPGKGGSGSGDKGGRGRKGGRGPGGCQGCSTIVGSSGGTGTVGMPYWTVSEPYVTLWVYDTPLVYDSPYGPDVALNLAFDDNRQISNLSGSYNQGAYVGRYWSASWLSFVEVDASGNSAEVLLPASGWGSFTFPAMSNTSYVNYQHNSKLEKVLSGSTLIGLKLYRPDGSYLEYGSGSDQGTYKLFFMTGSYDAQGNKITFNYSSGLLSTVVSPDGNATFTMHYDGTYTSMITSVTSSYGPSVTLTHGETGPGNPDNYASAENLTTIVDAAGITSHVWYPYPAAHVGSIETPYGTTRFSFGDLWGNSVFDSWFRVTRPDTTQEFFGLVNLYTGVDWPSFSGGQIPSSTPMGTLDSTERSERNTFYWDAKQFAGMENKDLSTFAWADFKKARIRHWVASTDTGYTHFDTLSVEQAPSPDGSTEGQLTWYDYAGKPNSKERGTQVRPSVIARVMPDSTTWYEYYQYNTIGKTTNTIEKWVAGGTAYYRTNQFTYSTDGLDLLVHRGPNNEYVLRRSYNSYHEVLTETNAVGDITTYTYEGSAPRRISTVTTPAGLLSTFTYSSGFLQKVVDSISGTPLRTNSYTWLDGDMRTHTDPRGFTRTFTRDYLHRLTQVDFPDSTYIKYAYTNGAATKLLDLTYVRDRLGNQTYYVYDSLRRLFQEKDPRGNSTYYGYCACGSTEYVTNALSEVTHHTFDLAGRNTIITYGDSTSVTNTYDALGRLTIVTDALGSRTNIYDNLSRVIATRDGGGQSYAAILDSDDHATTITNANGIVITQTFDDLGRIRTRTYPDSGVERFGYSVLGLVKYTNQLDQVTSYGYDAALRKTSETNANSEVLQLTYNYAGDLRTLTDGKSQVTAWGFDAEGRATSKTNQAGLQILTYAYNANGRLTNRWSSAKGNTKYVYDANSNLTGVDYPTSTDITFTRDVLNRVTTMVDAVGTTTYTYNGNGDLLTENNPFSSTDTTTYTYHANAPHVRTALSLQQPSGAWTNGMAYDGARRLATITSQAGAFTYTYFTGPSAVSSSRLMRKIALPSTSYITNLYDSTARLTDTSLKNSGGTVLAANSYVYNAGNLRTRHTRTDASYVTLTYDNIGQLKIAYATNSGGTSITTERKGYNYDAAWNLSHRTNNGSLSSFGVDSRNQLNAIPAGSCSYDNNGNLTSDSTRTFAYDDENQLASVTYSSSYQTVFAYDGTGRLRKRTENYWNGSSYAFTSETRYIYDGNRVIQERDNSNVPVASYTRGWDLGGAWDAAGGIGGLLARSHGYSAGNWSTHHCYHADAGGNITSMVDSSQAISASYRYDSFGNTVSSSGSMAGNNFYRFSSKEQMYISSLYYFGYRFYYPDAQRWLNRDPINEFGGVNLFTMVGNNPVNAYDNYGLVAQWVAGMGAGCAAGAIGSFFGSLVGGDSAANAACKAAASCALGGIAGLVASVWPAASGCAAGLAAAAAGGYGDAKCDTHCDGSPNKPTTCYALDALASGLTGCIFSGIPASEVGGEVIKSALAMIYSTLAGGLTGDGCDLGNGIFWKVK